LRLAAEKIDQPIAGSLTNMSHRQGAGTTPWPQATVTQKLSIYFINLIKNKK
jgi:hypothetical protein